MTARGRLWRRGVGAAIAASAVSVTAACGVTVENLPLPKPGVQGDTYRVHAIFEDALNLPAQAKVKIGGSDIGQVTDINTSNFTADVEMQIRSDIALPTNATAELRQATPLGDVFVALTIPPDHAGQPRIADGGTIALPQTSAGATVEELLASLSMLLNGGGLNELATIANELDSIVSGHGPELEHLLVEMTNVIGSLNQRTVEIDATLQGFDATLAIVNQNSAELGAVADALPPMIGTIAENTTTIGDLMAQISVTSAALGDFAKTTGTDLTELVHNTDVLMTSTSQMGDNLGQALDALHQIAPRVNASFQGETLAVGATISFLSIGALSDPSGSRWPLSDQTGTRWPDGYDVDAFIGSLIDVLQRVYARITGGY
ncbi:MAG TPA: MCE family protein [Aldersonia sp.]